MASETSVRVLLVEDHPDVAEMTLAMLRMFGCDVELAGSVADARARLQATDFDLLLTDYRLPDGDGMDVIRAAQGRPTAVLLTAYGSALDPGRPGDPPFRVIGKPIELDKLEALVNDARGQTAARPD